LGGLRLARLLRVAAGSVNPVKVEAVRRAMVKVYGGAEVKGFKVPSGVPRQPIGWQTVKGAVNRALEALKAWKAELGVGVEAGLLPVEEALTGYVDFQWCAIADREGLVTLGCSPGFEMPPEIVQGVLAGKGEVKELFEEAFKVKRIGETIGAIGFLSKGLVSRGEITEQAVLMALIPRINREIYRLNSR